MIIYEKGSELNFGKFDEMKELIISPNFTIDDIHKIREYTYEVTKNMTTKERAEYYHKSAMTAKKRIDEIRAEQTKRNNK